MERNHEVTAVQPLLDSRGELREPGWSRSPVQIYDRGAVKAPKWRIKEWDYYLVLSDGFAGAFTISDDGYIGLQSVSLLSFDGEPWEHTETVLNPFPMGKLKLPPDSSAGVTEYADRRLQMRFEAKDGQRRITYHGGKMYKHSLEAQGKDKKLKKREAEDAKERNREDGHFELCRIDDDGHYSPEDFIMEQIMRSFDRDNKEGKSIHHVYCVQVFTIERAYVD